MDQHPVNRKKPWYKKWWVWLIILFVIGGIGNMNKTSKPPSIAPAAQESSSKQAATTEAPSSAVASKESTTPPSKPVDQTELQANVDMMTGGTFVKSVKLKDKQAYIEFYKSFQEYRTAHPESQVAESQYTEYFGTDDQISKILVAENPRLLRKFPDLVSSTMTIPYDGKIHTMTLQRKALNEYVGFPIESLQAEDGSWTKQFSNVYVRNESNRQKLMDTFTTVN